MQNVYEKRADPRAECECKKAIPSCVLIAHRSIEGAKDPSLFLFLRLHFVQFFLLFDKRLRLFLELVEFFRLDGSRRRRLNRLAAAHLPFHELGESTIGTRAKLLIAALLGHSAIVAKNDDCIGALNCGKTVGNADCGVVATEKGSQSAVDQGL